MAILKVVAVFDSAIQSFAQPFFVPALGAALRGFTDEVRRPDSPLCAHPDDYELFVVGDFDQESGRLLPIDPVMLLRAKDCVLRSE